jgi:hypothetical protein
MPKVVRNTAQLKCSMGLAPAQLIVLPHGVEDGNQPMATVDDYQPLANILPFGMCQSMANPQVATATAAAQGVLTPQPCLPNVTAPWVPGSPLVSLQDRPVLTDDSKCMCIWAGNIEIINPGPGDSSEAGPQPPPPPAPAPAAPPAPPPQAPPAAPPHAPPAAPPAAPPLVPPLPHLPGLPSLPKLPHAGGHRGKGGAAPGKGRGRKR